MKKSLLGVLLAITLLTPALVSAKGLELIPKVGYLFSPEVTAKALNGESYSNSNDGAFSLGADLFFDLQNNLYLGLGLMWGDNCKVAKNNDSKIGFTNLYATLKYKISLNGSENDPFFIYPLLNFGFGGPGWEIKSAATVFDYTLDGGIYWGAGLGLEYKHIILEFIYGCNYATEKYSYLVEDMWGNIYQKYFNENLSYTSFRINLGYKFNL